MDLLEDSDDGHGVHGSDQAAEEQVLQQADVQVPYEEKGRGWSRLLRGAHPSEASADSPMAPPL